MTIRPVSLLLGMIAVAMAAVAPRAFAGNDDGLGVSAFIEHRDFPREVPLPLERVELVSTVQGEAGGSGIGEYFETPMPGSPYLTPPSMPVDSFYDPWRIGVDSGVIFPLVAQKAEYNLGWWARVYGQISADMGMDLFRTAVEIGIGLGQSQSSRSDQQFRITSNYTFLSIRGLLDFLPTATSDVILFAGLGGGIEYAFGHAVRPSGTIEEERTTNFNPLLEFGISFATELTPGFYLEGRATFTHPLGSQNIMLFSVFEIGVQFLFI